MGRFGSDLIRFGIVGSLGFLIDGSILSALVHWADWNPFSARIIAMGAAVLATWWLHRNWTFPTGRKRAALPQSLIYGVVQVTSLAINYGVFALLVLVDSFFRAYPVLAVAAGSVGAMSVTYLFSKGIAFAEPNQKGRIILD